MNASFPQPAVSTAASPASMARRDTPGGLSAGVGDMPRLIEKPVANQPRARIFGVFGEPGPGASQPEAVAPFIHVAAHALLADIGQRIRQYDLQVAHGALLGVVAARIRIQTRAAFRSHADEMRALV